MVRPQTRASLQSERCTWLANGASNIEARHEFACELMGLGEHGVGTLAIINIHEHATAVRSC